MSKHTPAPWTGGKDIPIRAVDQEALGYSIVFINTDAAARKDVARANARLIAAAPDGLDAAQEALIALAAVPHSMAVQIANRKLRAFIAKATGEQA